MYAYGRREAEKAINSVDDIINHSYSRWSHDQLINDIIKLYNKGVLSSTDEDKLITFLCKGLSQSYIGRNSDRLMAELTKHLILEKNVTKIIKCCGKHSKYEWIDNLIKLGYKLTEKQQAEIVINGYKKGLKLILDQDIATYNDLETICKSSPITIANLDKFLDKFKLVPNITHLNIAIKSNNLTGKIFTTQNKSFESEIYLDNLIICFLNHGMEFTVELLLFVMNKVILHPTQNIQLHTFTETLFSNKIITSLQIFNELYSSKTDIFLNNICVIYELADRYNLEHDTNIFQKIITQSHCVNNVYIKGMYSNYPSEHDKRYGINMMTCIDYFLKINYIPTITDLELACDLGDELSFDKIYAKLNTFTDKCLIGACKSGSTNILNKLFSMKAIPNDECVKVIPNLPHINNFILNILLQNGLLVNHSIIELCLKKNMIINILDDYGINYDLELYKICHKYNSFINVYIDKIKLNTIDPNIHYELRYKIKYQNNNENVIIEQIKKINYADDMMYDDAVVSNKYLVINYLETNWGLKPNLKTLALIPNIIDRMNYLEKLKGLGIIIEQVFETVASVPVNNIIINPVNENNINVPVIVPTKKVVKKTLVRAKKN